MVLLAPYAFGVEVTLGGRFPRIEAFELPQGKFLVGETLSHLATQAATNARSDVLPRP
jgi:hypothetical protein